MSPTASRRYTVAIIYLTLVLLPIAALGLSAYNVHRERIRDDKVICDLAALQARAWTRMSATVPAAVPAAGAWRTILRTFHCQGE